RPDHHPRCRAGAAVRFRDRRGRAGGGGERRLGDHRRRQRRARRCRRPMNIFVLGFKSLWRQPTMLWFASAGLTAVLAPLLLLYGFKCGVITALLSALREQPATREIVLSGNYVLQPQDIEHLRAL